MLDQYVAQIQAQYPDLRIEKTELNDLGQYSAVVIVNDALVFRFPRYAQYLDLLTNEAAVLRGLQGRLPLPIPNPIYQAFAPLEVGQAFIGYELIPGEPLWRETIQGITDEIVLDRLAGQIGAFLKALHHVPTDAIDADLQYVDTVEQYRDMYQRIQAKLFGYMREDARQQVTAHFEGYLNQTDQYAFTPALRHGDFGTINLLYDPQAQQLTGVLDFGGAGLGDPAVDLAGIYSTAGYGEAFLGRCQATYPEIETMMDRVRFHFGTFALEEALFGIEHDDREAFNAGIEEFR
jgi:aminoglycoside 2''-phosphotransferase